LASLRSRATSLRPAPNRGIGIARSPELSGIRGSQVVPRHQCDGQAAYRQEVCDLMGALDKPIDPFERD
jgi:hypothetical protein